MLINYSSRNISSFLNSPVLMLEYTVIVQFSCPLTFGVFGYNCTHMSKLNIILIYQTFLQLLHIHGKHKTVFVWIRAQENKTLKSGIALQLYPNTPNFNGLYVPPLPPPCSYPHTHERIKYHSYLPNFLTAASHSWKHKTVFVWIRAQESKTLKSGTA